MQLYTAIILMWSITQGALSHYIFHQFLHNDTIFTSFKYIRPVPAETPLHITDKNDIRCNRAGANGQSTNVLTITAGDTVAFKPTSWIHHPEAYAAYLSAVPPGKSISNYAGDGDWFKIWEFGTYPNLTAESAYQQTWYVTLSFNLLPFFPLGAKIRVLMVDLFPIAGDCCRPTDTPNPNGHPPGKYLLRFEHVALHLASQRGGAEFYPSCAHVEVLNAGWKSTGLSPGPTARFPEAHEAEEHGKLVFNIWDFDDVQQLNSRKMPGPQVWDGR
ncbi:Putative Glycoside Hydrolase Family 61 [Podospora comata]|uniref:lytic cellulose monooxygenase (C4-dehydrogenating) n=1 Tax=Podospora comata TaxID=48703 RepID=A0ABY6S4N7_PODCO|nr:Putative Glycoside Hydrolase Family 61 [Podospora comata]